MGRATHALKIDRSNPFDDDFGDAGETITDARREPGITLRIGNDALQSSVPPRIPEMSFVLSNRDEVYGADSTVREGALCSLVSTHSAVAYPMFLGRIDRLPLFPGRDKQYTQARVLGPLGTLPGTDGASTALLTDCTVDEAIDAVLDAVGWSGTDRNLGTGNVTLPFFWLSKSADPWATLVALKNTEGPLAQLIGTADGDVDFQESDHRTTATASTVTQNTFRGSITSPIYSELVSYDPGTKGIVNSASIPYKTLTGTDIEPEVGPPVYTYNSASATSGTFNIASASIGDLMILMLAPGGNTSVTAPSGWSKIENVTTNTLSVCYRTCDGTEGGTVTASWSDSNPSQSIAFTVKNVADYTPLHSSATLGSSTTAVAPQITTTVANTFLLLCGVATEASAGGTGTQITAYKPGGVGMRAAFERLTSTVTSTGKTCIATAGSNSKSGAVLAITVPQTEPIWSYGEDIVLAADEVFSVEIDTGDLPFDGALAPAITNDYTRPSGTLASGPTLSRTSGSSATLSMTAGGSGVTISGRAADTSEGIRVRANKYRVTGSGSADASDATSITANKRRGLTGYPTWQYNTATNAQVLAEAIVAALKDKRPVAGIKVYADRDATTLVACLGLEVSDQLRVIEDAGNIDLTGWCEGWEHHIGKGERVETTIWIRGKPS